MITQQQYDELKVERDALAAQVEVLQALAKQAAHDAYYEASDKNRCDRWGESFDEDIRNEFERYWFAVDHFSSETSQKCLNEIRAEAVLKFAEDIGVFSRECDDQGYVEVAKWRVKEYAEQVRQGAE